MLLEFYLSKLLMVGDGDDFAMIVMLMTIMTP